MRVASKLPIDLKTGRNEVVIAKDICNVIVMNKGTGNFSLKFMFIGQNIEPLELDQSEVSDGDNYGGDTGWRIKRLLLTNTAQTGKTLTLIVEMEE